MSKIGGQRAKLNKILDISVCSDFDSNATIQSAEEDDAIMEEEEEEKNQDHKAIFSKLVLSERFFFVLVDDWLSLRSLSPETSFGNFFETLGWNQFSLTYCGLLTLIKRN